MVDKLVTTVLRDTPSISAALGHGNYLAWIEAEFEMSERTAERHASIFDAFGGKSDNLSNIGKSALSLLAAPSTPEDVREEVLAQAARSSATPSPGCRYA